MTACPHCGEPISQENTICPVCGAAVGTETGETQKENVPAEKTAPAEETAPAKEAAPAEETTPEKEIAAEETATEETAAGKKASVLERLRKMRQEQRPAFLFDAELRGKILRRIGCALTALGLLALLSVAVLLIVMQRQQRASAPIPEEQTGALPARPAVINYFTPADPGSVSAESGVRYVPDELIAVAAPGISYTDMERFFGEKGIRVLGYVELTETYQLSLPGKHSLYGLCRMAEELETEEAIACAAVNAVWEPAGCTVPEDPWDGDARWDEAAFGSSNWGLTAIRAPESWERFAPGTVRIGLIDSAFDPAHEDLQYGMLHTNEGFARAKNGNKSFWQHGTAVAAVAGAIHDNGRGISGAAEDCLIYACGSGSLCGQMDAISAMAELAAQDVRVMQMSLSWQEDLLEAILQEDSKARRCYWTDPARVAEESLQRLLEKDGDFLLVLPAGNGLGGEGTDARYSSAFAGVKRAEIRQRILVVGAAGLDKEGTLYEAPFSGTGERVDLLGPGVDIYTALPQGEYTRQSGSSLAAAYASALAAEAWALNPALSGAKLRELLVNTACAIDGSPLGLLDMTAALEEAEKGAEVLPARTEEEMALDSYAGLLHRGAELTIGASGSENRVAARNYLLLDMDEDGVEELLLYALDEENLAAGFALYGCRNGELCLLANSWENCRFSSWSNSRLSLEVWDGRNIFAAAQRSAAGVTVSGECFWLSFDGEEASILQEDLRPDGGNAVLLIDNSAVTEEGIRIGSARDLLWER